MIRMALTITITFGLVSAASAEIYTPGQEIDKDHDFAQAFLVKNCTDCHGDADPEAGAAQPL